MGSHESYPAEGNPYGLKLIVELLQERAAHTPNHTYIRYPGPGWEEKGYTAVTWRQYLDAVNRIAHWLDETLGPDSNNDTIAYAGPNDIRYGLILLAVIKTNRKLLVCDGRITGEGLKSLLLASECKTWLYADDHWALDSTGIPKQDHIKEQSFPSLEWCLSGTDIPDYPYTKTWEEGKDDEITIIHTSGTTGFPKPIWFTNAGFAILQMGKAASKKYFPRLFFHNIQENKVGISAYPPKWGAGLAYMTMMPLMFGHVTVVLPPDTVGIPPELFKKVVRWNPDVDGLNGPPQPIEQLWKDPTTQPLIKEFEFVIYAGAAMDQAIGDEMCMHTRLTPLIGSTEGGLRLYTIALDRRLWNTFDYLPDAPHRFVPAGSSPEEGGGGIQVQDGPADPDALYELVYDRPADGRPSYFSGTFWNRRWYDGVDSVATRELYAPVRDLDGATRWVFRARADDLTKLSFLAKFNATHIEARVKRHPAVRHVLVGGEGRPVPYVLIEPQDGALQEDGGKTAEQLVDDIYNETVALSNKEDIGEIRIPRDTVFLADRAKPFKINLKALVLRREVEKEYKEEIDAVYEKFEAATGNGVGKKA